MNHRDYKFSVTIKSDDLAVIHCMRALAQYAQKTGNNRIPWGGTKETDWKKDNHEVTFRFTSIQFRTEFIDLSRRIIAVNTWSIAKTNDNNPAKPQS